MPRVELSPLGRPLTIRPRRTGYKHRPILTVVGGVGMTENGETVTNLPLFATSCGQPYIWCAYDVASIIAPLRDWFADVNWFTWDFSESRDPELTKGDGYMSKARLTAFGFHKRAESAGFRRMARHMVWQPDRMFSDPSLASNVIRNTHVDLQAFAQDVRAWCQEQDLQLRGTLPSLAAQLLRDGRFWPHLRGRVPMATNEAIRKALPGVHQRRLAPLHRPVKLAVGLDQRRAYHRAAQEIPTPDPTTMFARGFYNDPEGERIWAEPGSDLYERTVRQPGVIAVRATARPAQKHELRPPAVDKLKGREDVIYVWTNELPYAVSVGLRVIGITAAWTSLEPDTGLPRYGAFAESEIDSANELRRHWLKPTLHAAYGMFGSRQRAMVRMSRYGTGVPSVVFVQGQPLEVIEGVPRLGAAAITNVPMLGVLQAEIRRRSLDMASTLSRAGVHVLHVHADGLHVEAGPMPLVPQDWTMDAVTNLVYEDDVSWLSDERDVLPGRDARVRADLRRHRARLPFEAARYRAA